MSRGWLALALLIGACESAGEPRLGAPVVADEPAPDEPAPDEPAPDGARTFGTAPVEGLAVTPLSTILAEPERVRDRVVRT